MRCTARGGLAVVALVFNLVLSAGAAPSAPLERETMFQAAANVKRLIHTSVTGTLASTFPSNNTRDPSWPYAIMEYHAPCYSSPDLLFLLFPESISTQNILASEDHRATYTLSMPIDGVRSPVSRARVAFMGNMTFLHDLSTSENSKLAECYKRYHPDTFWFPSSSSSHPWDSMWAKFSIRDIYYVGGFGDTHYIGHIPVDVYDSAHSGEDVSNEDDLSRLRIQV